MTSEKPLSHPLEKNGGQMSSQELPCCSRRGRSAELLPSASKDCCRGRGDRAPVLTLLLTETLGKLGPLSESQFPHPQIGAEGQPNSSHWGEDERRCNMGVPSTQLVSGIWVGSPLPPFELKCHSHTASPTTSNGRVFLYSHYSVTLSDPFSNEGPCPPPTTPSITLRLQMGACVC